MTRVPWWLVLPWLVLAVFAAGLFFTTGHHHRTWLGRTVSTGAARIGGPFALVDQNGTLRRDGQFRGRYLLVYFGYSHCPDVCPTTLATMASAYEKLGARKARLVPLFMTVDPARDTPEVLKAYLSAFGEEFVGLTGSSIAIARVAKEYGASYAVRPLPNGGYTIDHSSAIYLMGPDGKFIAFYESPDPDALAADLKKHIVG